MKNILHQSRGFSLIEIIVVVAIMLTMTGLVTANYVQYSEEKKLDDAVITLREVLAVARSKAGGGDVAGYPCDGFAGYQIILDSTTYSTYPLNICCSAGCGLKYNVGNYEQKTNIRVMTDATVIFSPYAKGTNLTSPQTLVLKNTFINKCNYITVSTIGVIEVGSPYSC